MARRVPPLTARHIATLRPQPNKQVELVDGQVPGLRVRMNPSGVLSWSLNVRAPGGNRRRYDIGVGLTLAEARRKAEDLRQQIRAGIDPTIERRQRRARVEAARRGEGTLVALLADYYRSGPGSTLSSKVEQAQRIRSVFQEHLERPAPDLHLAEMQRAADRHVSPSSAARAVAYLRPVLKWAARRDLASRTLLDLERPFEHSDSDAVGQRVLSRDELTKVMPALRKDQHGRAALFMLYTAARRSEVAEATWGEIDLDAATWTVPPIRRKDTRSRTRKRAVPAPTHIVPLPHQAVVLLREIGLREPDDVVFANAMGGVLGNWDRWQKRINNLSGVSGWDRHALRRTCATLCGEHGAEPHIISVVLGHRTIGSALLTGYNKARYSAEHRLVLQEVADELERIEQGLQHKNNPQANHELS